MDEYSKLKSLLFHDEKRQIAELQVALESALEESRDPTQIIDKIAPLLSDIFSQTIEENKEEFIKIFSPLINDLLKNTIKNSSVEIAKTMAPIMGMAIKDQVKNERDVIIDALYPVMGNMISKFVSESFKNMLEEINKKVQSTFSFEAIKRRIISKVKGVSETELLLQNSSHLYIIQTVFLIHKESGILISERSASGEEAIEPEMVASMLTAIRSFVNDWISKNSEYLELNEIEFGDSTIRLEVAGCCYLAIVLKGSVNSEGQEHISKVLEYVVENYSDDVVAFNGDLKNLPIKDINERIDTLFEDNNEKKIPSNKGMKWFLWALFFVVLGLITWSLYIDYKDELLEDNINSIIYNDPKLNLYNIKVKAQDSKLILTGRLPAQSLHTRLVCEISKNISKSIIIVDNTVQTKPLPTLEQTYLLISGIVDTLNSTVGNLINFEFSNGAVYLDGVVSEYTIYEKLVKKLSQLDGVRQVFSTIKVSSANGGVELFYDFGKSSLTLKNKVILDSWIKINNIKELFKLYKNMKLLIVGYTDGKGNISQNNSLAIKRAKSVKEYLVKSGIDEKHILSVGVPIPPENIYSQKFNYGKLAEIKWIKE